MDIDFAVVVVVVFKYVKAYNCWYIVVGSRGLIGVGIGIICRSVTFTLATPWGQSFFYLVWNSSVSTTQSFLFLYLVSLVFSCQEKKKYLMWIVPERRYTSTDNQLIWRSLVWWGDLNVLLLSVNAVYRCGYRWPGNRDSWSAGRCGNENDASDLSLPCHTNDSAT